MFFKDQYLEILDEEDSLDHPGQCNAPNYNCDNFSCLRIVFFVTEKINQRQCRAYNY